VEAVVTRYATRDFRAAEEEEIRIPFAEDRTSQSLKVNRILGAEVAAAADAADTRDEKNLY
jgi:hypothetical protein